jgi:aspartate-semialdehyde dehydrogenase
MKVKIGIVGATGIVGSELIALLNERHVRVAELRLFASEKSVGKKINWQGSWIGVERMEKSRLKNLDYLFFCAGKEVSQEFLPAAANGVRCIDNSSAFRDRPDVPLVVPEINPGALDGHRNIIANPNCSTIIALMGLFPLHKAFELERFFASTYQAVSGVGRRGLESLERDRLGNFALSKEIFGEKIEGNAIPFVGQMLPDGHTSEEMKMLNESRKILSFPGLKVSSTCVRIPVERAHSIAVVAQFKKSFDLGQAEEVLANDSHIDYFPHHSFPTALGQSHGDRVGVGRVRMDACLDRAVAMWIVGDQIRKGAALNAVQIMELMEP